VVEFASERDARRAVAALNGTRLGGREIHVRLEGGGGGGGAAPAAAARAAPAAAARGQSGARIFVGNLAWETRWQELKDAAAPYGVVVRADVIMGNNGRSQVRVLALVRGVRVCACVLAM
jgi:RNA recognition motif-containing protein